MAYLSPGREQSILGKHGGAIADGSQAGVARVLEVCGPGMWQEKARSLGIADGKSMVDGIKNEGDP